MKDKILQLFLNEESENYISPRTIRVGLVAAILMYVVFGIADKWMAPESYKNILMVRYSVIASGILFLILLNFVKSLYKYIKIWLTLLILSGQAGIVYMIYLTKPGEFAYYEYYIGLVLIMLWAGFIFRLSVLQIVMTGISSFIMYNIVAVFYQKLPFYGGGSDQFGHYLNNNLVLMVASVLSAIGAIKLDRFSARIYKQNKKLEIEKIELDEARKKAEVSDRLKSAFLANMSHEIRTPMNAILGFAEMLKKPNLTKLKEEKYVDIIYSKGKQLLNLINDIIDIARIEANELIISKSKVHLHSLLHNIQNEFQEYIKIHGKSDNLTLVMEYPTENKVGSIFSDEHRLHQIFTNLISNAVKFTSQGEIRVGYKVLHDQTIQFFVSDTGEGISLDKQEVIFERFRQADEGIARSAGGTGLGLNIVRNLVEMLGGKIWLTSEPGTGSVFYFTIAYEAVEGGTINSATPNQPHYDICFEGHKILIAEDNKDNFIFLKEALNKSKCEIIHVENGSDAIKMVRQHPDIHIVLMDMKMPVLNGYDATKEIKKLNRNVIVIAQTAYAMKEEEKNIMEAGCDYILTKPIKPNDLLQAIRKFIEPNNKQIIDFS